MRSSFLIALTLASIVAGAALAAPAAANRAPGHDPADARPIDIALCLDTSGSMSGLLNSAREKLWAIVNDLALADPTPRLRVALLTFGSDMHSAEDGYVQLDLPFTDDLDSVSAVLFGLAAHGNTEYVGRVVHVATRKLEWSSSKGALKLLVVAGNESAEQDPLVSMQQACREAGADGIVINSIYCGPPTDMVAPGWRQVAELGEGYFASIDQDHGTLAISSPYDDELTALGLALNETYIPYGKGGEAGWSNQRWQDSNAASVNGAAAADRAVTKGGRLYKSSSWDLVDALEGGAVTWGAVDGGSLPEAMRPMTHDQRCAHVAAMAARRKAVQRRIGELSALRRTFIAKELAAQADGEARAFDRVLRTAIRSQARDKGFTFPGDVATETAGCAPRHIRR